MTKAERRDFSDTVKILMQLDKQNLLIINSGASLLLARQNMDEEEKQDEPQAVDA